MKKVTKIVTLAAASMCAFAVVGASFAATADARARANATAAEWRNIQYIADSRIKVSGPEMAKAGTKVAFSLEYNHRNFEVTGVRVGNGYAAEMDDSQTEFYFVMPNEDTDVVVEMIDYTAPAEEAYSIVNVNAQNGLYLNGAPAYAKPGDVITFSISMAADAPIRFNGACDLGIVDEEGEYVDSYEFDSKGDNLYTFTMPEGNVAVYTYVEAKYFFLTFPEEQLEFVKSVKYKDKIGDLGQKGTAVYNDPEGYFLPFGGEIEVEFKNTRMTAVAGVKLNEQELTFENTRKVKFTMPGKDIHLELLTEYYYRYILADNAESNLYPASLNYNYDFMKFNEETSAYEEFDGKAIYGDKIRAFIQPKDDERIATTYDVKGFLNGSYSTVSFTKGNENGVDYVDFTVGDYDKFYVGVKAEAMKYRPVIADDAETNFYAASLNYSFAFKKSATSTGTFEDFDATKAPYGEYVRAYVISNNPAKGPKSYDVKAQSGEAFSSVSYSTGKDDNGRYVQFQVGNYSKYVVCVATEGDRVFADNHAIVGSYKYANIYSSGSNFKTGSSAITIDEFGGYKRGSTTYSITADGENSPAEGPGSAILVSNSYNAKVFYGNDFYVESYYAATRGYSAFTEYDLYIAYKAADSDTIRFDYRLQTSSFGAVTVVKNGTAVANMFYTLSSGGNVFYTNNVTFEFTSGSALTTASSAFDVKVNGELIGSVNGSTFTAA